MTNEIAYTNQVGKDHIKKLGQYFTAPSIADFCVKWVLRGAKSLLDPAVGNSVFLTAAKKHNPDCKLTGYEIDPVILDYFGNPADADLRNADFLLCDWDDTYDAIVCNPPYNRFQAIPNREEILSVIHQKTGRLLSSYTNLYILFLIKCIHQLSPTGRLAFVIPTEFFNSKYGTPIKKLLLENTLLREVIHFSNNDEVFFNATTTCCLLLLDREPKDTVHFYRLDSIRQLKNPEGSAFPLLPADSAHAGFAPGTTSFPSEGIAPVSIRYDALDPEEKWRCYLNNEQNITYTNTVPVSTFCNITRGIATGANDFFCLTQDDIDRYHIPAECIRPCICRSKDVSSVFFTEEDFIRLRKKGKPVYLLDGKASDAKALEEYLAIGTASHIPKRNLPSHRNPWFSMEHRDAAPIWVASACRNGMKFVRNLAQICSLTTFHSIYVKEKYKSLTDIIFCYFLTSVGQELLRKNRKELGNHLDKFQPGDLSSAKMLNLTLLSENDRQEIQKLCILLQQTKSEELCGRLEEIFLPYLLNESPL